MSLLSFTSFESFRSFVFSYLLPPHLDNRGPSGYSLSTLGLRVLTSGKSMEPTNPAILTPRDREILKDVILTYILTAEPVSSRSVAKHGQLGLSAASIRNVMADLEEWGSSPSRTPRRAACPPGPRTTSSSRP
jgi:hypothetical protein